MFQENASMESLKISHLQTAIVRLHNPKDI